MKFLVVGGAGYIGAHIVDILCELNYDVVVFDNLSTGYRDNLNPKASFIKGDILNKTDLDLLFENQIFDGIVHLAALKAAGESMIFSQKYSNNNIIGSINLINKAVQNNVKKFIFSSSAAVYGEPKYNPIDEKHTTNPINHYGYTKLMIEKYLSWIQKQSVLKFVSLRYFNAAGYTPKKNLIKYKEKNPQNLLPIIMEVVIGIKKELKVFGNNYNTTDGTCIRDYIHVNDLADAHVKSLNYLNNNPSCAINLSTGSGCSVLEVIQATEKITSKKIPFKFVEKRLGDPAELISSNKLAHEKLNWKPQISDIEQIILTMWNQYK